jgi:hypothetical protein
MALRSLDAIGFDCRSQHDLASTLAEMIAHQSVPVPDSDGRQRVWRSGGGAEITFRFGPIPVTRRADDPVTPLTDLVGLSVYHQGGGAVRVSVLDCAACGADDPCGGAWHVALAPDRFTQKRVEIMVEMSPYQAIDRARGNRPERTLAIAGLCHKLQIFADVRDYMLNIAPRDLMPPGSIVMAHRIIPIRRRVGTIRQSAAIVSGVVVSMRRQRNPVTQRDYQWLLVGTEYGEIDVVAALGTGHEPAREGQIVLAHVDLTARSVDRVVKPVPIPVRLDVPSVAAAAALPGVERRDRLKTG